jgi:hypothetical protein
MFDHLPTHDKFFAWVSERLTKENDLSDLTWALCKTSRKFLDLFLNFFEFEINIALPIQIVREASEEGDRPDFMIFQGGRRFFIEVKIDDQNDHMKQYAKRFPDAMRGLIARHKVGANFKFVTKTWDNFYHCVRGRLAKGEFPKEESATISGYLAYLKEVCQVMELETMRFEGLYSLACFNEIIRQIIVQIKIPGYTIRFDNKKTSYFENCSGVYFSLKKARDARAAFPWFGIWYGEKDRHQIMIEIDDYSSNTLFRRFQEDLPAEDGKFHKAPKINKEVGYEALVFKMRENCQRRLFSESLEGQRKILTDFYSEVVGVMGHKMGRR